jgi:hypothetical protein
MHAKQPLIFAKWQDVVIPLALQVSPSEVEASTIRVSLYQLLILIINGREL